MKGRLSILFMSIVYYLIGLCQRFCNVEGELFRLFDYAAPLYPCEERGCSYAGVQIKSLSFAFDFCIYDKRASRNLTLFIMVQMHLVYLTVVKIKRSLTSQMRRKIPSRSACSNLLCLAPGSFKHKIARSKETGTSLKMCAKVNYASYCLSGFSIHWQQ